MRLDPVRLAARLIPGEGAPEVRRLRGGLVNETYQVLRAGRAYVLRLPSGGGSAPDREWECRVLACAALAGLAPALRYCEPASGILVSEWLDGRRPDARDISGAGIARMAALARRIHALEIPQPARSIPPGAWVERYCAILQRAAGGDAVVDMVLPPAGAAAMRLRPGAEERLRLLARHPPPPPVLCHGDLHPLNLVDTGDAWVVLDWEYSHVTDPYWDLASWSSANDWGAGPRLELLRDYVGGCPTDVQCLRFDLLSWLYDYVCLAWCGVRALAPDGHGSAAALAARAALLAARLDA